MSWVEDYKKVNGVSGAPTNALAGAPKPGGWVEAYKTAQATGVSPAPVAPVAPSGDLIPEDSPINMVLTQQDLNEMGETVKGLGQLALHPNRIVEGLLEFGSALPGFAAGSIGGVQELAKAVAHDPLDWALIGHGKPLGHYTDAFERGFAREAQKLPAWDSGREETKLVGRTIMAPFEGIVGPLNLLADSGKVNEDARGFLKALGVTAGFALQHGMSSRAKMYGKDILGLTEKAEKGTLTAEEKTKAVDMANQLRNDLNEAAKTGKAPEPVAAIEDPLARLEKVYKPETPPKWDPGSAGATYKFTSQKNNDYYKVGENWYTAEGKKVSNQFQLNAMEKGKNRIGPEPEVTQPLQQAHAEARKESATTKALREAGRGLRPRKKHLLEPTFPQI